MGCKLDDFKVNAVFKADELNQDSFNFLNLIGRKAAWSNGDFGQDVIVAMVDTGVNPHPEFGDRLLPGKNFITNYGNTSSKDDNMHGTHTAGSVAGGILCGIAPQVKILPIKVLGADGSGEWDDVAKALNYLADQRLKGVPIVIASMSLSGGEGDITETEKTNLEAACDRCYAAGVLPICSMGNSAEDEKRYPACFTNVVAVGALDEEMNQAGYATKGSHIDVTARGTKIISAYYQGEYAELSGTSMSTPQVSGGGAVIASEYLRKNSKLPTAEVLKRMIIRSAKDIFKEGFDNLSGAGRFSLQPLTLSIKVEHGSNIAYVNGVKMELPVPISMAGEGYTMVPLRFIADKSGAEIKWYPQNEIHNTQSEFNW